MRPPLPRDLIALVLDAILYDDFPQPISASKCTITRPLRPTSSSLASLGRLSLVNNLWRQEAQRLLFQYPTLRGWRAIESYQKLVEEGNELVLLAVDVLVQVHAQGENTTREWEGLGEKRDGTKVRTLSLEGPVLVTAKTLAAVQSTLTYLSLDSVTLSLETYLSAPRLSFPSLHTLIVHRVVFPSTLDTPPLPPPLCTPTSVPNLTSLSFDPYVSPTIRRGRPWSLKLRDFNSLASQVRCLAVGRDCTDVPTSTYASYTSLDSLITSDLGPMLPGRTSTSLRMKRLVLDVEESDVGDVFLLGLVVMLGGMESGELKVCEKLEEVVLPSGSTDWSMRILHSAVEEFRKAGLRVEFM